MSFQYLFVCGCARSGTSIMTELLRAHTSVCLGRERYNYLFRNNYNLFTPTLFTPVRFSKELLSGDTHHEILDGYYDYAFSNWEKFKYIGDKIPSLYKRYDYIFKLFPNAKIIFLLRNIIDVCQSWENRKMHSIRNSGKWEYDRGYREAIDEWNNSLTFTISALDQFPNNVLVIHHEYLFKEKKILESIFRFLNLKITIQVQDYWAKQEMRRKELEKNRLIKLNSIQKEQLCLKSNFELYKELKEKTWI